MTAEEVQQFISGQENENTRRKTLMDTKRFELFLKTKNECRAVHQIPPEELDTHLANFLLSVRRGDGGEYEPTTLRGIAGSVDRKLKRLRYECSIFNTNDKFLLTKDALKAKNKYLKRLGKGNRPNAAQALTDDEISALYDQQLLGSLTPEAMLNTLWLNNTTHFGMRGVKENYELRWGDVQLQTASDGVQYLELNERQTKTRTGANLCDVRAVTPKIFATGEENCPVEIYKEYELKRPENFSHADSPFYLATRTVPITDGCQWFTKQRVGTKKLGSLLKTMSKKGNLDAGKRLTSHSARKHLIQKLRSKNIPATDIMSISGHRNVQSIINYSDMDECNQRRCSQILSNHSRPTSSTSGSAAVASTSAVRSSIAESSAIPHPSISSLSHPISSETVPGPSVNVSPLPHPLMPMQLPVAVQPPSAQSETGRPVNTMSVSNKQWHTFQSSFYGANLNFDTMNVYIAALSSRIIINPRSE